MLSANFTFSASEPKSERVSSVKSLDYSLTESTMTVLLGSDESFLENFIIQKITLKNSKKTGF
jgi:hypothetical protein